jgi:hypothetical protein
MCHDEMTSLKALSVFETSGTNHTNAQHDIPEERNAPSFDCLYNEYLLCSQRSAAQTYNAACAHLTL